jgi:hypothetical protein
MIPHRVPVREMKSWAIFWKSSVPSTRWMLKPAIGVGCVLPHGHQEGRRPVRPRPSAGLMTSNATPSAICDGPRRSSALLHRDDLRPGTGHPSTSLRRKPGRSAQFGRALDSRRGLSSDPVPLPCEAEHLSRCRRHGRPAVGRTPER